MCRRYTRERVTCARTVHRREHARERAIYERCERQFLFFFSKFTCCAESAPFVYCSRLLSLRGGFVEDYFYIGGILSVSVMGGWVCFAREVCKSLL